MFGSRILFVFLITLHVYVSIEARCDTIPVCTGGLGRGKEDADRGRPRNVCRDYRATKKMSILEDLPKQR
jgi:hypothetical protein